LRLTSCETVQSLVYSIVEVADCLADDTHSGYPSALSAAVLNTSNSKSTLLLFCDTNIKYVLFRFGIVFL